MSNNTSNNKLAIHSPFADQHYCMRAADHITAWLNSYAKNAQSTGFVVGISGGVDSALTSTLCVRTSLPTIGLTLPIRQKNPEVERAFEHCSWLAHNFDNFTHIDIPMDNLFAALEETVPSQLQDPLTMANARARLRMSTIYAVASNAGKLVAGTGNKVEDFGVGFFTKYGDGGVDLSPIADLYKTEVFAVAKALGVCDSILSAAPTDGLWEDGRTDEQQLKASYAEIEWAMEFKGDPADLPASKREVLQTYQELHHKNKHKFEPIPVCSLASLL